MKLALYLFFYCFIAESVWASEFSAVVRNVKTELVADGYELNADIDFKLSPVAREALQKGISLAWRVVIKVEREGVLWNSTLQEISLGYQIQNHALLNLYSVKSLNNGEKNIFSTLAGALDYISKIRRLSIIEKHFIKSDQHCFVAIKVIFQHEALPVPIRPFSYFDSQWALSGRWAVWPLAK